MSTKLLLSVTSIFLGLISVSLIFLPVETAQFIGITESKTIQLVLQLTGGLYFGFSMINWMAKGSMVGGIYNRPLVIGNFSHFLIGGLALVKAWMADTSLHSGFLIMAVGYVLLGAAFAYVMFRHPGK